VLLGPGGERRTVSLISCGEEKRVRSLESCKRCPLFGEVVDGVVHCSGESRAPECAADVIGDVECLLHAATPAEVRDAVERAGSSSVPVVDEDGTFLGTVSSRDVLDGFRVLGAWTALDLVRTTVAVVTENTSVADVLRRMATGHARAAIVVNDRREVVGVVTDVTALRALKDSG
jgi:CBS-domain-containing membrane protein